MTDKSVRLIDANGFIEDIKTEITNLFLDGLKGTPRPREELNDIIDRINEQPTIDAVPVVRCVDCKYFEAYQLGDGVICDCTKNGCTVTPNDYCSAGRRVKHGKF